MIYQLIIHACLALLSYLFLIEGSKKISVEYVLLMFMFIVNIFMTIILLFYIWGNNLWTL